MHERPDQENAGNRKQLSFVAQGVKRESARGQRIYVFSPYAEDRMNSINQTSFSRFSCLSGLFSSFNGPDKPDKLNKPDRPVVCEMDPSNSSNPVNPRPLEPWNPRTLLGGCSVRKLIISAIVTLWIVLLSSTFAQSQANKNDLSKKPPQADMIAVSDRYVIGPEDVLYIHVWREEALSRSVPVRSDGKISLPLINDIQAAGLTPLQLREILTQKFKEFIDSPNVSVVVTEANSMRVFVSGQVRAPGVYRLRSETTLLQIIPMAGGFTDWANQKKILIIRNEDGREKRFIVNYKKIIKGDDPNANIHLKAGDSIIVP